MSETLFKVQAGKLEHADFEVYEGLDDDYYDELSVNDYCADHFNLDELQAAASSSIEGTATLKKTPSAIVTAEESLGAAASTSSID